MITQASMDEPATERQILALPQIDGGRQAWSFVAAGFTMEMLLWGGLFSTGVFLKHYSVTEVCEGCAQTQVRGKTLTLLTTGYKPFSHSSETKISLIGTVSLFLGCKIPDPTGSDPRSRRLNAKSLLF